MSPSSAPLFHLFVVADADPVVLIRLIERIQSLGLLPQHLSARWLSDDRLSIELECAGLNEARIGTLVDRISQFTTVHSVKWAHMRDTV